MTNALLKKLGVSSLTILAAASLYAAEPMTKVRAVVSYPANNAGVYEYDLTSYKPTLIKNQIFASGGGINFDDGYSMEYYAQRFEVIMGIPAVEQYSYYIDKDWAEDSHYTAKLENVATDLAYSYDRNQVYGCFMDATGEKFFFATFNPSYFSHSNIAQLPKEWSACDFASDGTLYAIDCDGDVWKVNLNNAQLTPVGSTGIKSEWITGGFIDKANDTFYWSAKTDDYATLYKIQLPSTTPVKVYDLENQEQLGGYLWDNPVYEPKAPAANISSLSPSFSSVSLTGTLRINPPSTTVDGEKGEGDITYHILANGKEIATGQTKFAATSTTVNLTLPEPDTYCIAVVYSNDAGYGPRKIASNKYYGPDTPKPTTRLTPTYTDGKISLSWGAVSSGAHGGYIDTSTRHYRLTRYANGQPTVLSDELTGTSYTDELELPAVRTEYYYTIECIAGGLEGAPFASAKFNLGPLAPAFTNTFTSALDIAQWTTAKGENETKEWAFQSSYKAVGVSTATKPSDSWIFTPVVRLQGGKSYPLSIKARSYSKTYTETFEVRYGNAPTIEAMTQTAIASSSVADAEPQEFFGSLDPETDGEYYIGLHATTEAQGYYLYVTQLSVGEGTSNDGPAAPAITARTDGGNHRVWVDIKAPAATLAGNAISQVTRTELYRDGKLIASSDTPVNAGESTTLTDEAQDLTVGNHAYTALCYAGELKGALSDPVSVYVGYSKPTPVTALTLTEDADNPGTVTVAWTAPAEDSNGTAFAPGALKYYVYDRSDELVAADLTEPSVTLKAVEPGNQIFARYKVLATSEGGQSEIVTSANLPVGTPYTTPWKESFANAELKSIFGSYAIESSELWTIIPADTDWGVSPQDNDGGMAFLEGYARTKSALYSGKIDLADLQSPALTFYVFAFGGSSETISTNEIEVQVRTPQGPFQTLKNIIVGETGPVNNWNKVIVPLEDFAGQVVRFQLIASVKDMRFFYIDNLQLTSVANHNLSITAVQAPRAVKPGEDFNIEVTVTNNGSENARGYRVILNEGTEEISRVSGPEILPEQSKTITFPLQYNVLHETEHTYTVQVEYTIDELPADNTSEPILIDMIDPALPMATTLNARIENGDVVLDWTAPNLATAQPEATTETFENTDAWSSNIDGWTFRDLDKGSIGGIGSRQLPVSGQQSFFVFDNTLDALQSGNIQNFAAHSGKRYLCSMYSNIGSTPVQSDDWAITPRLSGTAQVVSFYASSFKSDPGQVQYLETFEILYSTTGTATDDFKTLATYKDIPATWMKYQAYLPAGTQYMAIRARSIDKYMLFIDDVTFVAANGTPATLNHNGYNIYRDGVRLNDTPVTDATYTDLAPSVTAAPRYTYHVTALYTQGESRPSDPAHVDMTLLGADIIEAPYDADAVYHDLRGIRIANPSRGNIYIVRRGSDVTKELLR